MSESKLKRQAAFMGIRILKTPGDENTDSFYSLSSHRLGIRIEAGGACTIVNDTEKNVRDHFNREWNGFELTAKTAVFNGRDTGFSKDDLFRLKQILTIRSFHHGEVSDVSYSNRVTVSDFALTVFGNRDEADTAAAAFLDMDPAELRKWLDTRESFLKSR